MNTFYKSQLELSNALIKIIDSYWSHDVSEDYLIRYLETIYNNNQDKIIDDKKMLKSVVKQRLGKKRLILMKQVLAKFKIIIIIEENDLC